MTPQDEGPASPLPVRVVAALPVLVPVLVTALALSATTFVLLESYSLTTVLPVALVLAAVGLRVAGLGEKRIERKDLVVDVLALGLALGFAVFNGAYSAQDVTITRDPGTYTVASQWLVGHDSLDIDGDLDQFGGTKEVHARSAGIGPTKEPNHLYAQGAHVLPAVLGVSGRVFGTGIMYRTNALIGGLALLAVYGFARNITGRRGALLAAAMLAIGVPQMAFSRDNYSEPISQLFVFGGLALLWQARRGDWGRWALAGLVLAGSCLARIDAFLVLPAIAGYGGLLLAAARKGERRVVVRDVLAFGVGATVSSVLGYLDLTRVAPGYYNSLKDEYHGIMLGLTVALAGAVLLVAVAWLGGKAVWDRVADRLLPVLGTVTAGLVVVGGLVLASRPLWMTSYGDNHPGTNHYISILQTRDHLTVDPNRRYYEHTVTWLSWYLGPLCVALALVGLAVLVRRAWRERDLRIVPFVLALLITAGYYLVNANIVPDQIWAMRRFLPVVLPGVAIAGAFAAVLVVRHLAGAWRTVVTGVGLVALVVPILHVTQPLATVREFVPELLEIQRVCQALPDDAAVLTVGEMEQNYPMTVRTFCHVPAVGAPLHTAALAQKLQASLAKSGRTLYVLADADLVQTTQSVDPEVPAPVSTIRWTTWRPVLDVPVRATDPHERRLYLGRTGPDGRVVEWALPR